MIDNTRTPLPPEAAALVPEGRNASTGVCFDGVDRIHISADVQGNFAEGYFDIEPLDLVGSVKKAVVEFEAFVAKGPPKP